MFALVFGFASVSFAKESNEANDSNKAEVEKSSTSSDREVRNSSSTLDRDIEKDIKDAVEERASSSDDMRDKADQLEKRSKIKTFLIGTDYKTVGALRSEMVKTRNEINKINKFVGDLASSTTKDNLLSQVKTLEETQTKIEELVTTNESKFSLFGWFVKLFQK